MLIAVKSYFSDNPHEDISDYLHVFDTSDLTVQKVSKADIESVMVWKSDSYVYTINGVIFVGYLRTSSQYEYNGNSLQGILTSGEEYLIFADNLTATYKDDICRWEFDGVVVNVQSHIINGVKTSFNCLMLLFNYIFKFKEYYIIRCGFTGTNIMKISLAFDKSSKLIAIWDNSGDIVYGSKRIVSEVDTLSSV